MELNEYADKNGATPKQSLTKTDICNIIAKKVKFEYAYKGEGKVKTRKILCSFRENQMRF